MKKRNVITVVIVYHAYFVSLNVTILIDLKTIVAFVTPRMIV